MIHLSNCTPLGIHYDEHQSMVESGVTEGGKNTPSFLFREWTQQHKHQASTYIKKTNCFPRDLTLSV